MHLYIYIHTLICICIAQSKSENLTLWILKYFCCTNCKASIFWMTIKHLMHELISDTQLLESITVLKVYSNKDSSLVLDVNNHGNFYSLF